MPLLFVLFLSLAPLMAEEPPRSVAGPNYGIDSIVNAASFGPHFAPNMLVAVFGKNMAWTERWRSEGDMQGDLLPFTLPGTYVTATVNSLPAAIEYASPTQVMFLLPPGLRPGPVQVWITVAGIRGPILTLDLQQTAPALYRFRDNELLARRAETYEFVDGLRPARPGDQIILYANSLGDTVPAQRIRTMPRGRAEIVRRADFRILLGGEELAPERIGYVGIMPGYPAFYEIHLQLPEEMPANPEIRACVGEACSAENLVLRTEPEPPKEIPVEPVQE